MDPSAPMVVWLANVELVERPKQQRGYPRVRLLIQNPSVLSLLTEP